MSEKFNNFYSELRTKINDADKRIKDMKANAVGAGEKAKVEAKAQLAALENKAKEQKARTAAAEAKVKTWVEEKKTMTHDKIAEWKQQRDVKRLESRADLSERYAVTAMGKLLLLRSTRLKGRPSKPSLPAWMPTASRRRLRARARSIVNRPRQSIPGLSDHTRRRT